MLKNIFCFALGIVVAGLLIDRGVDLPNRVKKLINPAEFERLGNDIHRTIKK